MKYQNRCNEIGFELNYRGDQHMARYTFYLGRYLLYEGSLWILNRLRDPSSHARRLKEIHSGKVRRLGLQTLTNESDRYL